MKAFYISRSAAMSSITLTLSGNTSELSANYFPPIKLDEDGEYVCGLVDFQTFMSIPNIAEENNRFYYLTETLIKVEAGRHTFNYFLDLVKKNIRPQYCEDSDLMFYVKKSIYEAVDEKYIIFENVRDAEYDSNELEFGNFIVDQECTLKFYYVSYIEMSVGSYELSDIEKYLTYAINKIYASAEPTTTNGPRIAYVYIATNKNTLKCEIESNLHIFFNKGKTFRDMLGFKSNRSLAPGSSHESDLVVNVSSLNTIKIDCNITSGAYSNDKLGHTIHEFYPSVDIGYKIVEVPQNVIYLPVTVNTINNLTIRCVDQNNKLVNFRGETITLRVHIKKILTKNK